MSGFLPLCHHAAGPHKEISPKSKPENFTLQLRVC
jgi:hypothetical protein